MGDRSNYADRPGDSEHHGALLEHRLGFNNDARGYTPFAGDQDGDGAHGNLAAHGVADNYFKSARFIKPDPGIRYTPEYLDGEPVFPRESAERRGHLEAQMPTYRPTPHPLHGIRPGA